MGLHPPNFGCSQVTMQKKCHPKQKDSNPPDTEFSLLSPRKGLPVAPGQLKQEKQGGRAEAICPQVS